MCNPQSLLNAANCFATLPKFIGDVTDLALWCDISTHITPVGITNPPLLSTDGFWYVLGAVDLGGGAGTADVDQTPVPPGTHPYLILPNLDDGLNYKLSLVGASPFVFWEVDETPSAEALTPTILTDGVTQWTLALDGSFTVDLTPI